MTTRLSRFDLIVSVCLAAVGVAAIAFGLWTAWPPLAWIFGGSVCVFVSVGGVTVAGSSK